MRPLHTISPLLAAGALGLCLAGLIWPGEADARTKIGGLRLSSTKKPSVRLPLLGAGQSIDGFRDLRRIAADTRPEVTRHLLTLSEDQSTLTDPRKRMELVRALASHEAQLARDAPLRAQVVRALSVLFEDNADRQPAILPHSNERRWIRGTAAMALGRSKHPEGLRLLVAVAHNTQTDPVGALLARRALDRFLTEESAKSLAPLFSLSDVRDLLAQQQQLPLVDHPEKLLSLPKTRHEESRGRAAKTKDAPLTLPRALRWLKKADNLPSEYGSVSAWRRAESQSALWTLRVMTILSDRLDPKVLRYGARLAESLWDSSQPAEAHAALWLSSALEARAADGQTRKGGELEPPTLLDRLTGEKLDTDERDILLGFSSQGPLARTGLKRLLDGTDLDKGGSLFLMPLHETTLWPDLSTARLRALQSQHNHPTLLAPLSTRMRQDGLGLGPKVLAVRTWLMLDDDIRVRSAAARGLGETRGKKGSAVGLLLAAYRQEPAAPVRRAIVRSLRKLKQTDDKSLGQLLELDPDPGCAARARGSADPDSVGFYWGHSERDLVTIEDREGRVLEVVPAADGFVGLIRDTL